MPFMRRSSRISHFVLIPLMSLYSEYVLLRPLHFLATVVRRLSALFGNSRTLYRPPRQTAGGVPLICFSKADEAHALFLVNEDVLCDVQFIEAVVFEQTIVDDVCCV